jgi:hypothetical protein
MGVLRSNIAASLAVVAFCTGILSAQSIKVRIYSEFDRLNTAGEAFETIPGRDPLEIISPAVVRNGYTSFHVAVTARPAVLYWFAVQTNPAETFRIRVYKESPDRASSSLVMDQLTEEPKPLYFLATMPDGLGPTATDVYLLDIWTPQDASVGTVRLEAMVKEADWVVAPMEVRILPARVPDLDWQMLLANMPAAEKAADIIAWNALLTSFTDQPLPPISPPVNVRSVIRRNAVQDAALIRSLTPTHRQELFRRIFSVLTLQSPPGYLRPVSSADVYLPIRRFIYISAFRTQR